MTLRSPLIDEQADFLEALLSHAGLPRARLRRFRARLDAIRERQADTCLHLAVLGEFSSGKSAFINALIGDRLLKTSTVVSTATPTEIRAGERLALEVRFNNAPKWLSNTDDLQAIERRVRRLTDAEVAPVGDLRSLLHLLTSHERVAPSVSAVRLQYPSPILGQDVAVIDTPGLNAEHKEHAAATLDVVAGQADACVVVMPSMQALPTTLLKFLKAEMRAHLHRCVFVLTKMAQVEEDEQEELVAVVQRQLERRIGVIAPMVLPCSVGVVLAHLDDPTSVAPQDLRWATGFDDLKRTLHERLESERLLVLNERLIRLLEDLMRELRRDLRKRSRQLEADRKALEAARVSTLEPFVERQRGNCRRRIATQLKKARAEAAQAVDARRGDTRGALEAKLAGATTKSELTEIVKSRVEPVLTASLRSLDSDMKEIAAGCWAAIGELMRDFDERFEREYSELRALDRGRGGRRTGAKLTIRQSSEPADLMAALDELHWDDNATSLGAAATGAAIGMVVPGIGPMIGGLIGLVIGGGFRQSVDERRAALLKKVKAAVTAEFRKARSEANKAMDLLAKDLENAVDEHIEAYLHEYEAAVRRIVVRQSRRTRALEKRETQVGDDLAEIQRRLQRLRDERRSLAQDQGVPNDATRSSGLVVAGSQ